MTPGTQADNYVHILQNHYMLSALRSLVLQYFSCLTLQLSTSLHNSYHFVIHTQSLCTSKLGKTNSVTYFTFNIYLLD